MDRDELDKRLDDWIDSALEEYGRADPRPGIEMRIWARLKCRVARRCRWLRRRSAAWIAVAVTIVLVAVAVRFGEREKAPMPDFSAGYDEELLVGVGRMVNQNVPAALEPGTVLSQEIAGEKKNQ